MDAATFEITTVAGGGAADGDASSPRPSLSAVQRSSPSTARARSGASTKRAQPDPEVDAAVTITTVATGALNFPMGVAVDCAGNIFVAHQQWGGGGPWSSMPPAFHQLSGGLEVEGPRVALSCGVL